MSVTGGRRWRFTLRAVCGVVILCAIGMAVVEVQLEPYRIEWLAEQRALAEMRRSGYTFTVSTKVIGPRWLRTLSGPFRAPYFERVTGFFFVASDAAIVRRYRPTFKYSVFVFQD
jgi:hypothetical protein